MTKTLELTADGWFYMAEELFKKAQKCADPDQAEEHRRSARKVLLRLSTVELLLPNRIHHMNTTGADVWGAGIVGHEEEAK